MFPAIHWAEMWKPELSPLEVFLRATVIYALVQILFRLLGRRELGKYSTFDLAMVFLISTAVRQSIVANDDSLTSAAIGLGTIIAWDWVLSKLTFRSERFALFAEGPTVPLISNGVLQPEGLARCRVSESTLRSQLRLHGHDDLSVVKSAFLERSGSISFVLWPEQR